MDSIVTRIVTEMVHKVFAHIEKNGLSELSVMGKALQQYSNECVLQLLQAVIEETDRLLLENKALRRSDRLTVQQKDVPRELVTVFGELRYRRTYYRYISKGGSPCYVYLTDEIIGVESYERITKDLVAEILSDVDMLSYGKAAENNGGQVSRQTVHDRLLAAKEFCSGTERLEVPEKGLDIFADEDHVHIQTGKGKPRKSVTVPLVTITEGIQGHRTVRPFHVQGYGMQSNTLAENVLAAVCQRYDMSKDFPIRVHCDGGGWIRTLADVLPNTRVYADGFHLQKHLKKLLHLKNGGKYAQRIRSALSRCDWDAFFSLGTELAGEQDEKGVENANKVLGYFYNNREAIGNRMRAKDGNVCGSCTEGLISQTLSARLSRDPLSWSEKGLRKISSLIVFKKNGGKITTGHIRKSVSERTLTEEAARFKENGFEKYYMYAKEQTDHFLRNNYDWSTLDPARPTYGKIDGTRALLSALGKVRDTICA